MSVLCGLLLNANPARAQSTSGDPSFPTADTVVQRIYREGMQHSQVEPLAQVLMDSIGDPSCAHARSDLARLESSDPGCRCGG